MLKLEEVKISGLSNIIASSIGGRSSRSCSHGILPITITSDCITNFSMTIGVQWDTAGKERGSRVARMKQSLEVKR